MEPRIRNRFTLQIRAEAARRYGVAADALHELDGAESFIFEFVHDGQPRILRIGHSLRRNPDLIRGEVDWINYLAAGGANVAKAVNSVNDELVELIDDGAGEHFLATAFVKATGGPPPWQEQTPVFIEHYGQTIGRMHRLTQSYQLPNPKWRRLAWDAPVMLDTVDFLPPSEVHAREQYTTLVDNLRQLPQPPDAYGLVHQDAHLGNAFADGGQLTFFDFDDCAYSWFVNDIAIVLFYVVNGREDPSAYAHYFLPHFLRGYQRENHFDAAWFAHIPDFLKLRELDLYGLIHRSFDVNDIDDPWAARYMNGRKERIDNDVPYIDVDFAGLQWQ